MNANRKTCKTCKQEKAFTEFRTVWTGGQPHTFAECKECFKEKFLKVALKGALSYRKGKS